MPSKVREPRQPSLEGLNDHITAAGPLQRDGPQTDVAGPVRTEQMRKVATPPWEGQNGVDTLRGHHAGRGPALVPTPLWGDAGPAASLYLWKALKPRPESGSWLRAIPEDHPGVSTESYAPSGWNQEHICWTQSWWKMPAREEARVYLDRCGGSVSLTSLHRQLFCRGRNQKRAGSSRG